MNIKKFFPVTIICGGIFFIFLWLHFVFIPIQSQILEIQTETKRLQAVEKDLEKLQRRNKNLSEFAEFTEENLSKSKKLLPEKSSEENFSEEIYKSAEKNKILINSLKVGELISEENFQKQSVQIKIEGNYTSILNFISDIYDGKRFAKPENISMENSGENFITCNAEFFIFSLK